MRWLRIIPCAALTATLAGACDGTPVDLPADEAEILMAVGDNNGAVVHHDEIGCALLDASGSWFPADFSLPCGLEVATYGNTMTSNLSAQATGVPNNTGRTVHWGPWNTEGTDWAAGYPELTGPPYPCFVLGPDYDINSPVFTMNWKAHVTPSGNASLVCHYSKKWEFNCEDWGNCAP